MEAGAAQVERNLTTLEYVVLGFIAMEPQSGYSIISTLEAGAHRWSASPGSIYPILKRLEQAGYIQGELEMVQEARARKMYDLTGEGGAVLDEWLTAPFNQSELLDERDITLLKFLFMEKRLTRERVLQWLEDYRKGTEEYDIARRSFYQYTIEQATPHMRLILESTRMDLDMQKQWIEMAIARLRA